MTFMPRFRGHLKGFNSFSDKISTVCNDGVSHEPQQCTNYVGHRTLYFYQGNQLYKFRPLRIQLTSMMIQNYCDPVFVETGLS